MYLARYFRKNSLWAKTTKCGQKWHKNMVFPLFWKNLSLIFAENILKLKLILLSILLYKFHIWGNYFSRVIAGKAFKMQDFLITYILMEWPDDIDFLHVDRYLEEERKFNQIFQWCSAYRLLQSCSVIENIIEWKEETFPCIFK